MAYSTRHFSGQDTLITTCGDSEAMITVRTPVAMAAANELFRIEHWSGDLT